LVQQAPPEKEIDMTIREGTRTQQSFRKERVQQGSREGSLTRDVGMTKNVTASITFTTATKKLTAANGTFANFVAGDPIFVAGTNLNDGEFTITAIDGVNQAFLTVDPPPKNEGPLTATVRTT
jgi:hypothetical protein